MWTFIYFFQVLSWDYRTKNSKSNQCSQRLEFQTGIHTHFKFERLKVIVLIKILVSFVRWCVRVHLYHLVESEKPCASEFVRCVLKLKRRFVFHLTWNKIENGVVRWFGMSTATVNGAPSALLFFFRSLVLFFRRFYAKA